MTSETPDRAYGGRSSHERREVRRARLIVAAGELAGEGGRRAVTVRGVCQRAKLNPRYFYESFASIEELLGATFEGFVRKAMEATSEPIAAQTLSARAGTEQIMERVVKLFAVAGPESEATLVGALGNDAFQQRRSELIEQAAALVAAGIERLPGRGERGAAMTRVAAHMIVSGLVDVLVAWSAGRLSGTEDEMVEYCTDIALAAANATGYGRRNPTTPQRDSGSRREANGPE